MVGTEVRNASINRKDYSSFIIFNITRQKFRYTIFSIGFHKHFILVPFYFNKRLFKTSPSDFNDR